MARDKRAPQEILDEEHEQVLHRVCAIDVAKGFGQVCVRVPRADARRTSKVFPVDATTGEVLKLGETLLGQNIEMVTLESTSDYWRSSTTCSNRADYGCNWSTPATSRTSHAQQTPQPGPGP